MSSLLYTANIAAMATWLSLGSGSVINCCRHFHDPFRDVQAEMITGDGEIQVEGPDQGSAAPAPAEEVATENTAEQPIEDVPAVPEMPDTAELEPLPDVPKMPEFAEPTPDAVVQPQPKARPAKPQKTAVKSTSGRRTAGGGTGSPGGQGGGSGDGTASGTGSGSTPGRFQGGYMPKPAFSGCGDASGTVVIKFTVDQSGRVVSASITKSSGNSALDADALSTVRLKWKFKPGPPGVGIKPITRRVH